MVLAYLEKHMIWDNPKIRSSADISSPGNALIGEHRDRVLHEQAEAAQRRQRDLLEQTSMKHPAEIRIRIWEQLHQMDLPREPEHRLLSVIAAQTDLTIEQISREQQRRAQVRIAVGAKV
jgi:hypothetical protein